MSITPEDFVQMKNTTRCLIECIFAREDSFKRNVIKGGWSWTTEAYEINNVSISGYVALIVIRFEDYSETQILLELDYVYSWYENEFEKEATL